MNIELTNEQLEGIFGGLEGPSQVAVSPSDDGWGGFGGFDGYPIKRENENNQRNNQIVIVVCKDKDKDKYPVG